MRETEISIDRPMRRIQRHQDLDFRYIMSPRMHITRETMFSSDDEKDIVAKGVKSGACDFLIKLIQINILKILWQHVLVSNPQSRNNSTKDLWMSHPLTTSSSNNTHSQAENEEENYKSLKSSSEDEADLGKTKNGANKPHLVWTLELNLMFIMAVDRLGNGDAKPKKILQIMRTTTSVSHLTKQHVSSLLQEMRATD